MSNKIIGFHAAKRHDALNHLIIDGSHGKGPARLGLWTTDEPQAWQRSYGEVLHRVQMRSTARILEITSKELGNHIQGQPSDEDWSALGKAMRHDADVLVMKAEGAPTEIVILNHQMIESLAVVSWDRPHDVPAVTIMTKEASLNLEIGAARENIKEISPCTPSKINQNAVAQMLAARGLGR